MRNTKFKFERLFFLNRWSQPRYARNSNWVIFGIYKWWSWDSFCYQVGFLGFEMRIWFKVKKGGAK